METSFPSLLASHRDPLAISGVREAYGVHYHTRGWRSLTGKEFVHSAEESCVKSYQGSVEKRTVRSSVKTESFKEKGIEVDLGNRVTIAKIRVKLESKKDKESREWDLDRATTTRSDVRNSIVKAHKYVKREAIAASFGHIV